MVPENRSKSGKALVKDDKCVGNRGAVVVAGQKERGRMSHLIHFLLIQLKKRKVSRFSKTEIDRENVDKKGMADVMMMMKQHLVFLICPEMIFKTLN